ncbi:disabled homolog 2-like [Salarias fasciatus]|uniref:disabled homolog 2-like n=1 Tax=Salarias fasciatus TaxID=181472 RepID=UPI001176EE13|nr:disabled homolog 2-like [Salarias fasciatus]
MDGCSTKRDRCTLTPSQPTLDFQTEAVMMETEQKAGNCPSPGQTAVKTWLPSNTRGVSSALSDFTSRFHGDGVRYKAKLIGMDPVPAAQGEKMCWESMMKLKGLAEASRKQGKHKKRIWLKICSGNLKLVDERTGAVLHEQEKSNISSLTKDESDPRALAYIYQHNESYILFYIKTANQAGPVLADINEMCQSVDQDAQESAPPAQNISLLPLSDIMAEGSDPEAVFSPRPGSSNQLSSHNELMEVFSTPWRTLSHPLRPYTLVQSLHSKQHKPMLSTSQILSMYPTQPAGGPPYPPSSMAWGQQTLMGNPWAGPGGAPWPTRTQRVSGWAPPGVTTLPAAGPPPGGLVEGAAVSSSTSPSAFSQPFKFLHSRWNRRSHAIRTLEPKSSAVMSRCEKKTCSMWL